MSSRREALSKISEGFKKKLAGDPELPIASEDGVEDQASKDEGGLMGVFGKVKAAISADGEGSMQEKLPAALKKRDLRKGIRKPQP